jgi:glycosyltransferase involved in cell wall biosynthesis
MMKNAVLLISHDIVGPVMAGPGIRYYHLARVLAPHADVTLAIPQASPGALHNPPCPVVRYDPSAWDTLAPHVAAAAICIFPSDIADSFPQLADTAAYLVVDGYDPLLAEWLALHANRDPADLSADWRDRLAQLNRQYTLGDFFLCASERQRDWWIGLLEANGRLNPATYQADPSLRKLVDVVAYGLPDTPPVHSKPVIKGVWKGIDAADKLILWGGGLWSWLDPVTAMQAIEFVYRRRQDIRLIFPGARHPNPKLDALPTQHRRARAAAEQTGLLDKAIFFGDWVPYADWQSLLLECDLALTLHFDTLETRLAFRSRVLEYIWAGLPIIASEGDAAAELVQRYSLGRVVHYNDVDGVTAAIVDLLDSPADGNPNGFSAAAQALRWQHVAKPLIDYCKTPWHAADKGEGVYNPSLWAQLQQERTHWQELVNAYERGRYIRAMKWLDRQKRRIWPQARPDEP